MLDRDLAVVDRGTLTGASIEHEGAQHTRRRSIAWAPPRDEPFQG
jgi:hypothetical protein